MYSLDCVRQSANRTRQIVACKRTLRAAFDSKKILQNTPSTRNAAFIQSAIRIVQEANIKQHSNPDININFGVLTIEIINNTRVGIEGEIGERANGGKFRSQMYATQQVGFT